MRRILLFIFFNCSLLFLSGQCIVPFQDITNAVYIFDSGESQFLESLPLTSFQIGRKNILAYIAANNRLKVYYHGKTVTVDDNSPNYFMTDNWFLYQNYNVIKVLYNNEFKMLDNLFRQGQDSLYYSDSIIIWTNTLGELNVFYNGKTQLLERTEINRAKIGANIFAYLDISNNFRVWYQGQLRTLETYEPSNYEISQDMLMYIDRYRNFKFFHDGVLDETAIPATFDYAVGRDFAVFMSQLNQFVVYYKGEQTTLMSDRPVKYTVKENMIVYTDKGNNFWAWYQGKKYWLERYIPLSYEIDNDIVVYQDLNGRLKAFYYGEQVEVSDQMVSKYKLYNEAVTYSIQPYQTKIWCNKKTYTY